MELSSYVEELRRELGTLTKFASEDVIRVADQLAGALDSSVRLTLLDVLTAAAAEITTRLDETVIDVRLSGGEPEFVVTVVPGEPVSPPAADPADDAGTARVTLRLPESVKARIEAQAAADGLSVNTWLVHAAIRALEGGGGQRPRGGINIGQRISGYARS